MRLIEFLPFLVSQPDVAVPFWTALGLFINTIPMLALKINQLRADVRKSTECSGHIVEQKREVNWSLKALGFTT